MKADSVIQRLKEQGHRMTQGRRAIIDCLLSSTKPLSAPELHEKLTQKGLSVNKVTVYRELQFLTKQNCAELLTFKDGTRRYQLLDEDSHKHHLICTGCNDIQDVEVAHDDLHAFEDNIKKEKKFAVVSHSLEFYGLCAKCK